MMTVVFILVVLSVLGVGAANLIRVQHFSTVYALQGKQAYFAARAGLDYAAARIAAGAGCAGVDTALSAEGFNIALTCLNRGSFNEGQATSYSVYELEAVASRGTFAIPDVTTRHLRLSVKHP